MRLVWEGKSSDWHKVAASETATCEEKRKIKVTSYFRQSRLLSWCTCCHPYSFMNKFVHVLRLFCVEFACSPCLCMWDYLYVGANMSVNGCLSLWGPARATPQRPWAELGVKIVMDRKIVKGTCFVIDRHWVWIWQRWGLVTITQHVRWQKANGKVHEMSSAGEGVQQAWKNNVPERKMKRSTTHPASIFAAVTPATFWENCFARRVEGATKHQF